MPVALSEIAYPADGGFCHYIEVSNPQYSSLQTASSPPSLPLSKQTFLSLKLPTYKPTNMSFYASSENIKITQEGGRTWLVGRARRANGSWQDIKLDLDNIIGNSDGEPLGP